VPAGTGAEDFAYYAQKVPAFFFRIGALPKGKKPLEVLHHTPDFQMDEGSLGVGVKTLCHLALDYIEQYHSTK
jgi:metal-dependent amidase/aminoacylase/carboxypeptidase family protein